MESHKVCKSKRDTNIMDISGVDAWVLIFAVHFPFALPPKRNTCFRCIALLATAAINEHIACKKRPRVRTRQ